MGTEQIVRRRDQCQAARGCGCRGLWARQRPPALASEWHPRGLVTRASCGCGVGYGRAGRTCVCVCVHERLCFGLVYVCAQALVNQLDTPVCTSTCVLALRTPAHGRTLVLWLCVCVRGHTYFGFARPSALVLPTCALASHVVACARGSRPRPGPGRRLAQPGGWWPSRFKMEATGDAQSDLHFPGRPAGGGTTFPVKPRGKRGVPPL